MPQIATRLAHITAWLRAKAGERLLRNLGWFGLAEIFVRASRLITAIVLARWLLPHDFGIAAIVITTYELVRIIANNGTALMIVRAEAADVERTCATAWRVSASVATLLVVIQLIAAAAIGAWMQRGDVFAMLAVLSLAYLALPATDVRYCRILRANNLRTVAGINAAQVLADNLLTAGFALAGFGAWSIVLSKVLTVPLYMALLARAEPWSPQRDLPSLPWRQVRDFALPVLGTEALSALRTHSDKIIVGAILGVEALGIYTFALNAGLGLTLSLTGALSTTLYPHLAELANDRRAMLARFDQALKSSASMISLLVAFQAFAALFYVPIVFGQKWAFAAPLVSVLCLAGLARPLFDASSQLLRARGETARELIGATAFTAVLLTAFAFALPHGLATAAVVFTGLCIVGHIVFAAAVRLHAARDVSHPSGVVVA